MKFNWKRLAALLLAVILMLSLTGIGEEEIVIDNDLSLPEDIELSGPVNDLDLSVLNIDLQKPVNDEVITSEENIDDDVESNALVTKVKIGVKEKYTINTSSLSGKLTFTSSKAAVASVTKKGVITGKKVGTAKITIKTSKGKKYTVTVTVAKAPSKVTLNKKTATLEVGDTLQLKAKLPSKTASNKITWTSSNKNVATVSNNGKVTAEGEGTATITVKTFNGKKATCKVTVEEEEEEEEGYSGDIWDAIGTDFSVFNSVIADPLILYSNEDDYIVYMNNYMMVSVSYIDNKILTIMLTSGDNNGKYTITKIHPGSNLVLCRMQAEDAGWSYWKTEGYRYYYTSTYNGETIYLVLTAAGNQGSSNVNYVSIMRTE